jgi:hypothetical protein
MLKIVLCGWLALAAPGLDAQDGPKEKIKEAAAEVGHAVRKGAEEVKEAGKKVGHAVKEGAVAAKEGVKQGARKVGEAVGKKGDQPAKQE